MSFEQLAPHALFPFVGDLLHFHRGCDRRPLSYETPTIPHQREDQAAMAVKTLWPRRTSRHEKSLAGSLLGVGAEGCPPKLL